ncbi:MAG: hypothetical protein QOD00_1522 [Blastocatellia bacterium]|jgi:hypothetical protein|nr:hypothetical protein [Blastocatellia bacterium]
MFYDDTGQIKDTIAFINPHPLKVSQPKTCGT